MNFHSGLPALGGNSPEFPRQEFQVEILLIFGLIPGRARRV